MSSNSKQSPPLTNTHNPAGNTKDTTVMAKPAEHPLGPLFTMERMKQPIIGRVYATGIAFAAGILILTAAHLVPSSKHMGTHQQLKLPPCGFVVITGFPCPTCGMTTAYAYTIRGRFFEALRSQIAGFIIALATAGIGLMAVIGAATGYRPAINWYRINPTNMVWWLATLLILAWAAKIIIGLIDGTLPAR
ncbi:MAG: DUF2752 domain-containing protein [Planctomycetota bacterium]|nr:MAG: DUF2752 domain-containing protein [Planctomycetota bacterium]